MQCRIVWAVGKLPKMRSVFQLIACTPCPACNKLVGRDRDPDDHKNLKSAGSKALLSLAILGEASIDWLSSMSEITSRGMHACRCDMGYRGARDGKICNTGSKSDC